MELGTDPNRASSRMRRFIYREPVRLVDLFFVALILDDSVTTNTRVPTYHVADIATLCKKLKDARIHNVKIFAQELHKTNDASKCLSRDNLLCRAIQEFRAHGPDLLIAVETCLCPYTTNGSCGIHRQNGSVDIQHTHSLFGDMAILHAQTGADIVGPASMIPGTVAACRMSLDNNNYNTICVMPHLIFRTPFFALYRSIMQTGEGTSRPAFQVDPFNDKEAQRAYKSIVNEGASVILLEPGMFVMDIIAKLRDLECVPIGCFSTSGEYELLKYGAQDANGSAIAMLEFCRAAKRAGADFIATYAALEVSEILSRLEGDAC